jgi:hypothetical protein
MKIINGAADSESSPESAILINLQPTAVFEKEWLCQRTTWSTPVLIAVNMAQAAGIPR